MIRKCSVYFFSLFIFILSACGGQIPAQNDATPTADLDPCSSQNLPQTVQGINDLMREFDGLSQQASQTSREELPRVISDLQRIRRDAEDLQIPPCLVTLKSHQLNHMNLTIQALLLFIGGADQATLKQGIETAQQEHDLYSLEMVRLLGITLAPITVTPPSAATPP